MDAASGSSWWEQALAIHVAVSAPPPEVATLFGEPRELAPGEPDHGWSLVLERPRATPEWCVLRAGLGMAGLYPEESIDPLAPLFGQVLSAVEGAVPPLGPLILEAPLSLLDRALTGLEGERLALAWWACGEWPGLLGGLLVEPGVPQALLSAYGEADIRACLAARRRLLAGLEPWPEPATPPRPAGTYRFVAGRMRVEEASVPVLLERWRSRVGAPAPLASDRAAPLERWAVSLSGAI